MISGFLLINKPSGMTSHDVVDEVRKIYGQRQVGHAGTLDPMAEGLLIILLGDFTKKSNEFMKLDKEYTATILLGKKSDTDDVEGKIEDTEAKMPDLNKFRGKILQIPPQYSAIKIGGKKAYEEARAGRKVDLKPREVEIYDIEILANKFPELKLKINCSSGTYIRSLARDMGGVLTKLVRTRIGEYNLKDAKTLHNINADRKS